MVRASEKNDAVGGLRCSFIQKIHPLTAQGAVRTRVQGTLSPGGIPKGEALRRSAGMTEGSVCPVGTSAKPKATRRISTETSRGYGSSLCDD